MKFIHNPESYNTRAARQVVPYVISLLSPKSIIDVGCGIGTWLSIFKKNGIEEVAGIDGDYVDRDALFSNISGDEFFVCDLKKPLEIGRTFDLVISLEVAEHLPEESAVDFIEGLTKLGDCILFSAAIPGQGGDGHINEQWMSYWKEIFQKFDFKLCDFIRPKFWSNKNVDWWYRQNTFLFLRNGTCLSESIFNESSINEFEDIVHPELYEIKLREILQLTQDNKNIYLGKVSIKEALKILFFSLLNKLSFLRPESHFE